MKDKYLVKIVVYKDDDKDEYHGYTICTDSNDIGWELKSKGTTRDEAEKQGQKRFEDDEEKWHTYGSRIW